MLVVSDTTPVSSLYQIGQIQLLHRLFHQVLMPEQVLTELNVRSDLRDVDWQSLGLTIVRVNNEEMIKALKEEVDDGEAAAIAYCLMSDADLLLVDDDEARGAATRRGIKVLGTLGVLLQAKAAGLIPFIAPHLIALRKIKFYVTDELYNHVLQLAGE